MTWPPSPLDLYRRGQHEQVWTELVGAASPGADARAVAEETMQRVRENVERLRGGLPEIGYRFARPDAVLVPPAPDAVAQLDRLEAAVGAIPLALRVFCEVVGTVDLSGSHPEWPHELLDPLMVEVSVDYTLDTREDMIAEGELRPDEPFDIELAPDDLHKADISGGAPYAVRVPDAGVDALVYWEVHQTTFVNYLRTVTRFAGMGGMSPIQRHGHDPLPVPPEIARLAAGLQPF